MISKTRDLNLPCCSNIQQMNRGIKHNEAYMKIIFGDDKGR